MLSRTVENLRDLTCGQEFLALTEDRLVQYGASHDIYDTLNRNKHQAKAGFCVFCAMKANGSISKTSFAGLHLALRSPERDRACRWCSLVHRVFLRGELRDVVAQLGVGVPGIRVAVQSPALPDPTLQVPQLASAGSMLLSEALGLDEGEQRGRESRNHSQNRADVLLDFTIAADAAADVIAASPPT